MTVLRAKTIGMCMGVKRALALVESLRREAPGRPLATIGPLIHNRLVLDKLAAGGVRVITAPAEATEGAVVSRAHGLGRDEKAAFARRPVRFVDGTCPRVLKSQALAEKMSRRGWGILIVGDAAHDEVRAIAGYAETCAVLSGPAEAETCPLPPRAFVLGQSTLPRGEYDAACAVLRRRAAAAGTALETAATICPCTEDRQAALRALAAEVDALLVVGGRNSANTINLYKTALASGRPAWHVEGAEEIPEEIFACQVVGLSAGASTPEWIIREVETALLNAAPRSTPSAQGDAPPAAGAEAAGGKDATPPG